MPLARTQLNANLARGDQLLFVDDYIRSPIMLNGISVVDFEEFVAFEASGKFVSIAVANPDARSMIVSRCEAAGLDFFDIRALQYVEMDDVEIGEGALISPFVTFTSNIRIGRHFHCNLYSYVEHDCNIGNFVTFAPGVRCNGNVTIGDGAYIGSGAVIRQGINIGAGATIGMGAVVVKDVQAYTTVVGNPARPLVR